MRTLFIASMDILLELGLHDEALQDYQLENSQAYRNIIPEAEPFFFTHKLGAHAEFDGMRLPKHISAYVGT